MRDRLRDRYHATVARLRRIERRELREFRRWVETTRNLIHLSVLVLLPLVLGVVTAISNAIQQLPFLLFPPLASGSYTLFAQPESRYASPRRFVGGLTAGALCGWIALALSARYWYQTSPESFSVHPGAVALGLFLTGAVTWALDVEEPSAFAAALLVHVTEFTATRGWVYVVSVAMTSTLVAGVFVVWRDRFFKRRAEYLYESTKGDDHVLVPMRTDTADATAMLGGQLAAAHDAGKVVLLDIVRKEWVAEAEAELLDREVGRLDRPPATDGGDPGGTGSGGSTDTDDGQTATAGDLDELATEKLDEVSQSQLDEVADDPAVASPARS
jgi:hypothetical protein